MKSKTFLLSRLPGEASGDGGNAARGLKRGRKGRGPPPDAVGGPQGRAALLELANQSLLGAVALAADAARLLRWRSAGGESAEAACSLASGVVQWACEAAAAAPEGVQAIPGSGVAS